MLGAEKTPLPHRSLPADEASPTKAHRLRPFHQRPHAAPRPCTQPGIVTLALPTGAQARRHEVPTAVRTTAFRRRIRNSIRPRDNVPLLPCYERASAHIASSSAINSPRCTRFLLTNAPPLKALSSMRGPVDASISAGVFNFFTPFFSAQKKQATSTLACPFPRVVPHNIDPNEDNSTISLRSFRSLAKYILFIRFLYFGCFLLVLKGSLRRRKIIYSFSRLQLTCSLPIFCRFASPVIS